MALESEDAATRTLARLTTLAGRVRRPARRVCGSLRAAVVAVAALLGAFLLAEGSMYLRKDWMDSFSQLVYISGGLAFVGAIGNIAIVTAILGWGRFATCGLLSRLLCARLALAAFFLPLAPICILYAIAMCIIYGQWWPSEVVAWELGCFGGNAILAALLYSLLLELHGPGDEQVVSWVSTEPAATTTLSAAPTTVIEEPTPGPAPPPRRPH